MNPPVCVLVCVARLTAACFFNAAILWSATAVSTLTYAKTADARAQPNNDLRPYNEDIQLPEKEFLILENKVCGKPHNLKAQTIQGFKDTESKAAFDSALVQCQTHGEFRGRPMHYQTGCSYANKKWRCSQEGLEFVARINGKDIKIQPWKISPEAAYQVLAKISTYGMFQGVKMEDAIGSSCHVSPTKDKDILELNCQSIITVSFWCPQPQLTQCPRIVYVSPQPLI